ncbi:hypothetical protein HDU98_007366 [Podochytrium sp. JEL0797]|nr:hypothetical protein HDU98_007366 [Podochytrium sp. JEL0797]
MGGGTLLPQYAAINSSDPTLAFASTSGTPPGAGFGCFIAPDLALGTALDPTHTLACAPGFFCPYLNASDVSTLPVACPPCPTCAKYRLAGLPCAAQGLYEPIICKPGHFCPDHATMLKCPEGFYCPTGTVVPRKCTLMASCPKASIYQTVYLFLVIVAVLDAALVLLFWIGKSVARPKRNAGPPKRSIHALRERWNAWSAALDAFAAKIFGVAAKTRLRLLSQTMANMPSPRHQRDSLFIADDDEDMMMHIIPDEEISRETLRHDLTVLAKTFRDAFPRNSQVRMNFQFDKLELELKNGRKVLSGVTGRIREGRMTAILGPSGAGS